jgi:hypothetical protein
MVADSHASTGNTELARARLESLRAPGEDDADLSNAVAALIKEQIGSGNTDAAMRLQRLSSAMSLPPPQAAEPATVEPTETSTSQLVRIGGIIFFLFLLGVGVWLLLRQLQRRESARRRRPPLSDQPSGRAEAMGTAGPLPESTLGRFETTYNLGDESYDVSYSIESPTGEFLGECGISALEPASAGELGGAPAFELWLFDKEDVRTEAQVLMSEQAMADGILREEMAAKGRLLQAEEGQVVTLETANLRLDASIIELAYGTGLDSGSFSKLVTGLGVSLR